MLGLVSFRGLPRAPSWRDSRALSGGVCGYGTLHVREHRVRPIDPRQLPVTVQLPDLHRQLDRLHQRLIKPVAVSPERGPLPRLTNLVRECPCVELHVIVYAQHLARGKLSICQGQSERAHDNVRILQRVNQLTNILSPERVHHRISELLSFPRRLPRDCYHLALVHGLAIELPIHQIVSRRRAFHPLHPSRDRKPIHSTLQLEYRVLPARTRDLHPGGELGGVTSVSGRAVGGDVHFKDQPGGYWHRNCVAFVGRPRDW